MRSIFTSKIKPTDNNQTVCKMCFKHFWWPLHATSKLNLMRSLPPGVSSFLLTSLLALLGVAWCEYFHCVLYHPFEFFTNTQSWQCWHYCQLCIPIYLQFSCLFASTDVGKCEIRNLELYEDYIWRSNALLDQLIFNGRAKTKLAMLAFLFCGEIVKNSICSDKKKDGRNQKKNAKCEWACTLFDTLPFVGRITDICSSHINFKWRKVCVTNWSEFIPTFLITDFGY